MELPPGWSAAEAAANVQRQAAPKEWTGAARCYHAEMHAAEVKVARELARLAGRPPLAVRGARNPQAKIDAWITENEKGTGEQS